MNILGLFFNNELRTGGHGRYLDLMERLADRGHRVVVAMNALLDYAPRSFHAVRVPVAYVRRGLPPASLLFRRAVVGLLPELRSRAVEPDVLVVFGETHLRAAAAVKGAFAIPLLYSHRNNSVRECLIALRESLRRPARLPAVLWNTLQATRKEGVISRLADLIVFQSSYDLEDFAGRRPRARQRCRVVRGDMRVPRFKAEYADTNRSRRMRRILFVGTLGERKGVRYLVEAVELLADSGVRDLAFDVAGPGQRRPYWEARVRSAGIEGMVRFHGRIADPLAMMSAADLVIVPSMFDSYPNVILEALHVGTPVIGSRVGGIPDMLRHDELLFPPADARAIADRIALLRDDAAAYDKVRSLCRQRRSHFDFDWAGEFEALLEEITGRRGGSGPGERGRG